MAANNEENKTHNTNAGTHLDKTTTDTNINTHAHDSPHFHTHMPDHHGTRRAARERLENRIRTTMVAFESTGGPRTSPLPGQQEPDEQDNDEHEIKTEEEGNRKVDDLNEDIQQRSDDMKAATDYIKLLEDTQYAAAEQRIRYIFQETRRLRTQYKKQYDMLEGEKRKAKQDLNRETTAKEKLEEMLAHAKTRIPRKGHNTEDEEQYHYSEDEESDEDSDKDLETIMVTPDNILRTRQKGTHTQTGHPVKKIHLVHAHAICTLLPTWSSENDEEKREQRSTYIRDDARDNNISKDPMSYYTSSLHNEGHAVNTMALDGRRRWAAPTDSLADILLNNERKTRPENMARDQLEHILTLRKTLRWTKSQNNEYWKFRFPEWDSDNTPRELTPGPSYNNTEDMPRKNRREYEQIFTNQGPGNTRDERNSYWYTDKGQWRARHTPEEAQRLLMIRDVIKEMEEKHLLSIKQHKDCHKGKEKEMNYMSMEST
jgi:hypothetical protein